MRLLITDLDNTLYDWVTFFANAFAAMSLEVAKILEEDPEVVLDEFKQLHGHYGNSEQPFVVFELPSVRRRFANLSSAELRVALQPALDKFSEQRKSHLRLYEGVFGTLSVLREKGTRIVGHTEAMALNAYYRLKYLDIERFLKHLYALEGEMTPHPNPSRAAELMPPPGFLILVPRVDRKPNPRLLLDICKAESVAPADAWYVGDSLTRDVSMAKAAGLKAVWARYGTRYDRDLWDTLVRVTHWTDEDVRREEELRLKFQQVTPDYVIDGFGDLLKVAGHPALKDPA